VKFRSRVDICAAILEAATGHGAKKTKLMHYSQTSFSQVNSYLEVFLDNGLLEYIPKLRLYRATKMGVRYLQNYNEAWRNLNPIVGNKLLVLRGNTYVSSNNALDSN
jgi:predicted transcriptional regulator